MTELRAFSILAQNVEDASWILTTDFPASDQFFTPEVFVLLFGTQEEE